ncbi:major facilitator superfamily domain-containing protein [Aspergillus falconensis]
MASGSSLSGRLIPIIVARLLPRIGFLWTIRICAFLFLGLLCIAPLVVEPRVRPKPKSWELKAFFRPLREPAFLITTLGLSLFSWGMFIPFSFLVLEAQTHGMSLALANYQIAILNATSIFGRIIPGWLGDRIGRFNIAILTTALPSIFALALWIPATTPALTIAFAALFGSTPGTFVSITPALIQQLQPCITRVFESARDLGSSVWLPLRGIRSRVHWLNGVTGFPVCEVIWWCCYGDGMWVIAYFEDDPGCPEVEVYLV